MIRDLVFIRSHIFLVSSYPSRSERIPCHVFVGISYTVGCPSYLIIEHRAPCFQRINSS